MRDREIRDKCVRAIPTPYGVEHVGGFSRLEEVALRIFTARCSWQPPTYEALPHATVEAFIYAEAFLAEAEKRR